MMVVPIFYTQNQGKPMICEIDGCTNKPCHRQKMCRKHLDRVRANGHPHALCDTCGEPVPGRDRRGTVLCIKCGGDGKCSVDGCERDLKSKGMCGMHYERWRRLGSTELHEKIVESCTIDGCDTPSWGKHEWCRKHSQRITNTGSPHLLCKRCGEEMPGVGREDRQTLCATCQATPAQRCTVDGCGRPHKGHGFCDTHLARLHTYGSVDLPEKPQRPKKPTRLPDEERCLYMGGYDMGMRGCNKPRTADDHLHLGLCEEHTKRAHKILNRPDGVTMDDWLQKMRTA